MRSTVVAGYVLAGGRSSRMGVDKAMLEFCGQPLIAHALGILADAGVTASIAGAASASALTSYAPVIPDPVPGLGPLSGICAALAITAADYAVFVPVDQPLMPASLISALIANAETSEAAVTMASAAGFTQTFPAVLHRNLLPALQAEMQAERRGCLAAFQAAATTLGQRPRVLPVEYLVQTGLAAHPGGLPTYLWFANINTPGDLASAERHRERGIA